jgi:hypothetical protein
MSSPKSTFDVTYNTSGGYRYHGLILALFGGLNGTVWRTSLVGEIGEMGTFDQEQLRPHVITTICQNKTYI